MKKLLTYGIVAFLMMTAAQAQEYPAIAPPGSEYRFGQTVWYDLFTPDLEGARKFYEQVFGWQITDVKSGSSKSAYTQISNNGRPIGGMIPMRTKADGSGEWLGSFSVMDVKESSAKITGKGGKLLVAPTVYPGRGEGAVFTDKQGAFAGIIHASNGDPAAVSPGANDLMGMELWSNDQDESFAFYNATMGFDHTAVPKLGQTAQAFTKNGKAVAGCVKNPMSDVRTHWIPYIRVSNVADMAIRAKNFGARYVYGPIDTFRGGTAAMVVDPTGAPFVLQQF